MLAVASIGPCKWFAAFGITSKVSLRRGESTHLRPKSRLTAVGLRNAPAGAAPYNPLLLFITTTLIISKKPGNTGISRDIRTEFTTDLLLSD
jgi:hypothetical protein